MTLSEQRKELRPGKEEVEGGMGLRGNDLRQLDLRQLALKRFKTISFIRVRLLPDAVRAERRN